MIDFHTHPVLILELAKKYREYERSSREVLRIGNTFQPLETFLLQMDVAGIERAVLLPIDCRRARKLGVSSNEQETGRTFQKGYLHKLLRNPFYGGFFVWDGKTYRGTQPLIVDPAIFQKTREVLHCFNKPKYRKHGFAFSGLLSCAYDECSVTAEMKKNKYILLSLHRVSRKMRTAVNAGRGAFRASGTDLKEYSYS